MLAQNLFYFLSFTAILSAILVVTTRNPVYSVLYLIVTFFSIAGHYLLLNSQFLAAVHIIVYAGAIMVLFLYVIMMLNLNKDTEPNKSNLAKAGAVIAGCCLMIVLIKALQVSDNTVVSGVSPDESIGLVQKLGTVLYRDYLLPFEISAVLFLTAMVGAVLLAKKQTK